MAGILESRPDAATELSLPAILAALSEACAEVGLTSDGPELLRIGKNAIYQLAAAPVVVRIARSADRLRRVERELRVTRWLAAVGVPAIRAYEEMISRCWQMITRFVLAQGDRL